MSEAALISFAVLAGAALFFAWIVLLVRMDHDNKQRLRRMEQDERFRLIEAGLVDEEALARQKTEADRIKAVGAIGVAAALGAMGGASLLGAIILMRQEGGAWFASVVVACVNWAIAAAVVAVTVFLCFHELWHLRTTTPSPPSKPPDRHDEPRSSGTGIQEKPTL